MIRNWKYFQYLNLIFFNILRKLCTISNAPASALELPHYRKNASLSNLVTKENGHTIKRKKLNKKDVQLENV